MDIVLVEKADVIVVNEGAVGLDDVAPVLLVAEAEEFFEGGFAEEEGLAPKDGEGMPNRLKSGFHGLQVIGGGEIFCLTQVVLVAIFAGNIAFDVERANFDGHGLRHQKEGVGIFAHAFFLGLILSF